MEPIPIKIVEATVNLLKTIPYQRRKAIASDVATICNYLGIRNEFLVDRRTLMTGAKNTATSLLKRQKMPQYVIEGASTMEATPFTLGDAAEFMGVTPLSLKARVSSVRTFSRSLEPSLLSKSAKGCGAPDVYTCRKMTQSELDEQLVIFNETIKKEATSALWHTILSVSVPVR